METIKDPINLFWLCMLLHLIADYNLQGILADMKQKSWWKKQVVKHFSKLPEGTILPPGVDIRDYVELPTWYDDDWIAGLLCHAFMWSLVTYLPVMFLVSSRWFSGIIIANALIHAVIDHLKCNRLGTMNLCQDQVLHVGQLMITVFLVHIIA